MAITMAALPGHERPRERLAALGPDALSDRELLALVLRNGTRGESALDLASGLLADFGSLAALATALPEELERRVGVGTAKSAAVVAAFQLGRRAALPVTEGVVLRSAEDVVNAARTELADRRRERVIVLVCDGANRLRQTVVVSEGSMDRSLVPVREILNAVLRYDGKAFAVAHNHPSGNPTPSAADIRATEDLAQAAATVGLRFLDHVVLGSGGWRRAINSKLLATTE
ncbi:MAG TPA: DNA repair protein RadC [Actinopolymorphaceae bacterium]|jgi:DNA repair protein RadC